MEKNISYHGVSTLEILEGANNYNKWISDSLLAYAKPPLIEIGAGTGNISKFALNHGQLMLTEIDENLLNLLKRRFNSRKNISFFHYDVTEKPPAAFREKYNSVLAVNVLEHIENDVLGFRNMNSLLRKNGQLLILVPAKKFAYTNLDRSLGHFRRYEKDELKNKVEEAGFIVEKLYFFNFIGLFSWWIRDKLVSNKKELAESHVRTFDKIVPILRILESFIPIPVGISLICIAKKK
jgi:SAM-dependent methyltransferase